MAFFGPLFYFQKKMCFEQILSIQDWLLDVMSSLIDKGRLNFGSAVLIWSYPQKNVQNHCRFNFSLCFKIGGKIEGNVILVHFDGNGTILKTPSGIKPPLKIQNSCLYRK